MRDVDRTDACGTDSSTHIPTAGLVVLFVEGHSRRITYDDFVNMMPKIQVSRRAKHLAASKGLVQVLQITG